MSVSLKWKFDNPYISNRGLYIGLQKKFNKEAKDNILGLPFAGSRRFLGEIEHSRVCLLRLAASVPSFFFCCDRVFWQRNSICFWALRVIRGIFVRSRRKRSQNSRRYRRSQATNCSLAYEMKNSIMLPWIFARKLLSQSQSIWGFRRRG